MQAEQGEVVAQLHGLNGILLLRWVRDESEFIFAIIIPVVSYNCYTGRACKTGFAHDETERMITRYVKVKC